MTDSVGIGGRDRLTLLRSEARRRPEIAHYLAHIHTYTREEVAALPVPLAWYSLALLEVHRQETTARCDLSEFIVEGRTPDPHGTMYEYRGRTRFYASIQVEAGAVFFVQDNGLLWLDTVAARAEPEFLAASVGLRRTTKLGYKQARQERLNRTHAHAPVVNLTGSAPSGGNRPQPLAHLGVTIQR